MDLHRLQLGKTEPRVTKIKQLGLVEGRLYHDTHELFVETLILFKLGGGALQGVVSDTVLYLPLAVVSGFQSKLVVTVVLLAIISEMAGVVAVQIGASRRYDGPMGKSDRALVFGTVGLALGLGVAPGRWLDAVLCVLTALLMLTIVNRSRKALREAR
mgnify:CR=1 FL=1